MKVDAVSSAQMRPNHAQKDVGDGLERAFLGEMMKYAGPRETSSTYGGGIGESQMMSFLNDAYADAIAHRLDLGLKKNR